MADEKKEKRSLLDDIQKNARALGARACVERQIRRLFRCWCRVLMLKRQPAD